MGVIGILIYGTVQMIYDFDDFNDLKLSQRWKPKNLGPKISLTKSVHRIRTKNRSLTQSWKKLIKSSHPTKAPMDTRGRFHSRISEIAWTIASKSGVTIWDFILFKVLHKNMSCTDISVDGQLCIATRHISSTGVSPCCSVIRSIFGTLS